MPQNKIYYIRHGETDWNAENRYQGRRDIPLNAKGRRQAAMNGRKLAELIDGQHHLQFLTSPLGRTRQTMEIVLDELGRDRESYMIVPELIEATYGDLEGTTLAELKANQPDVHRYRKQNRWHFCPPNGESHEMVSKRIAGWLRDLEGDAVVVGHGVVGRVLRRLLFGLAEQEAASFVFSQDNVFIWADGQEKQV